MNHTLESFSLRDSSLPFSGAVSGPKVLLGIQKICCELLSETAISFACDQAFLRLSLHPNYTPTRLAINSPTKIQTIF
jgi:hypothetical protein